MYFRTPRTDIPHVFQTTQLIFTHDTILHAMCDMLPETDASHPACLSFLCLQQLAYLLQGPSIMDLPSTRNFPSRSIILCTLCSAAPADQ